MLGHSSVKMTEIYAKLLDDKVEKDMGKIFGSILQIELVLLLMQPPEIAMLYL